MPVNPHRRAFYMPSTILGRVQARTARRDTLRLSLSAIVVIDQGA
jgi:hypothetical protein